MARRCDCGKEIDVASNALLSGKTKSCGCAKVNGLRQRSKDITNQRFGRLMALKRVKTFGEEDSRQRGVAVPM